MNSLATLPPVLRVPHVGWNNVQVTDLAPEFYSLNNKDFYFVHSFYFSAAAKSVGLRLIMVLSLLAWWRKIIFLVFSFIQKSAVSGKQFFWNISRLSDVSQNVKASGLIPVLFWKDGWIVRSENFVRHQVIGDPFVHVERMTQWDVDELIVVNISREKNGQFTNIRDDYKMLARAICQTYQVALNIPVAGLWRWDS